VRMTPLRGHRSDAAACGQLMAHPMAQWQLPSGLPSLVAARALSRAENLQKLAETRTPWLPRVPATVREAQAVVAQAALQTMAPLTEASRSQGVPSTDGGGEPRGVLLHAAPRQPQAPRTVAKQRRQPREQAGKAWQKLCGTPCAGEAEARQARAVCAQGLQAPCLHSSTVHAIPHSGTRGRPRHRAPPAQGVSTSQGP
jgi:hypothetical protein